MFKIPKLLEHSKATLLRVAHMAEAVTLIVAIFGSGFMTGQWVTYQVAKEERLELRRDHVRELNNLAKAHATALASLAARTNDAAATAETAAETAQKAAKSVERVVQKSAVAPAPAKAPTSEQINKSVERANRQIAK